MEKEMKAPEERVLCLKREALDDAGMFQGIISTSLDVNRYLRLLDNPENLFFLPRSEADQNFRFKQWIPYVMVFKGGMILRYHRGSKGGESRLRGLYSVGVGGHITEQDFAGGNGYEAGMNREVREETGFEPAQTIVTAVINDDSTEVGRAHFGVVHVMRLPESAKMSDRREIDSIEFAYLREVCEDAAKNPDSYETWSRLCLERLL